VQYHPELDLHEVAGALRRRETIWSARDMQAAWRWLSSTLRLSKPSITHLSDRILPGSWVLMSRSWTMVAGQRNCATFSGLWSRAGRS